MEIAMSDKKTILLVDDDPMFLNALATTLEANYDVLTAADGLNAVYTYESNREKVAAIVTDLGMPRLDVQSLVGWIHHISPNLPVIIMSDGSRAKAVEDFRNCPTLSLLVKPFAPGRLEDAIRNALEACTELS